MMSPQPPTTEQSHPEAPAAYVFFLLHGINSTGENSIDRLGECLRVTTWPTGTTADRRIEVIDVPLPVRHTWNVRRTLEQDAGLLFTAMDDVMTTPRENVRMCFLAHSHGSNIALHVAREWGGAHRIWLFNPAVNRDFPVHQMATPANFVRCVHSPDDWIVRFSKYLPFNHPFGSAGAFGLRYLPRQYNLQSAGGHGAAFRWPVVRDWARIILEDL